MTNRVNLPQLVANAMPNFINLLGKTSALRERYNNSYGPEDARAEYFIQFYLLNLWLFIQFESFLEVFAPHNNDNKEVTRFSSSLLLTPQDTKQFMSQYDTINRASYCTHAMFNVEHLLKNIAKQLKLNPDDKYRPLTKKLKNELKLTEYQRNILNLPAVIRNSLHNNGYHTEDDFEVIIGKRKYRFEKGKQVRFAGWDNLYIIFDELLDVLEVIIESQKVKSEANIPHTSMTY